MRNKKSKQINRRKLCQTMTNLVRKVPKYSADINSMPRLKSVEFIHLELEIDTHVRT